MEDKLAVGMYVRTKAGIAKIEELAEDYDYDFIIDTALNIKWTDGGFLFKEDVEKASHNIIDLIQVGDYVNGEKIIGFVLGTTGKTIRLFTSESYINIENIKSIATKESMESVTYYVK